MRIIVYTGKGGVGKTSVAAATAARVAAQGHRTLVVSTDAAHSLADALDRPLGPEPVQVAERLWAQEIDSVREAERSWGLVREYIGKVMAWAKITEVSSEELLVFPGLEELFALLRIREHAQGGQFDVLVVDCAPTGETLRLLSFPQVGGWWLDKLFPMKRRMIKMVRPVSKVVTGGLEMPGEEMLDSVEVLMRSLGELQALLLDPEQTSVRLVLNPEKMVIAESRRSFTYLNLFGFNTDAVIVNRVFPEHVDAGYLAGWREIQGKYEEEVRTSFSPLPILRVPMMESEVVGLPMLERVGDAAFGDLDAAAMLHVGGRVEELIREPEGYVLQLAVPFASKEQIHLLQRGEELTVQVGWYKRKVLLPRTLTGRPVLGAKFASDRLRIRFGERAAEPAGGDAQGEEGKG